MANAERMQNPINDIDEIFNEFADMIYRLAFLRTKSSADADDIVQEVFLRYIKNAPALKSREHQKAWLLKVAANCTCSLFNSAWRRHRASEQTAAEKEMQEETDVYSEVLSLEEKYRVVIHLHYYEGYSIKEIAYITKASEAAVKTRLFRAREILRKKLKGEYPDV